MVLTLFFLFSAAETTTYRMSDLFDIRQGKLVLNNKSNAVENKQQKKSLKDYIDVLTLNSINWELSTIKFENLFSILIPKTIPEPLSNNDYIINRVGQTKGCSLLESDFDFSKNKVIPSHHFLVCSPRKIIIDRLPFFHTVLELLLNDLVAKKMVSEKVENIHSEPVKKENKQKLTYVTVKEIQNIEVEIPSENFDLLVAHFDTYYNTYANAYKSFMVSKEDLNNQKLELSKMLRKDF